MIWNTMLKNINRKYEKSEKNKSDDFEIGM